MDQLDVAVFRQRAAEQQRNVMEAAEQRRMLRERAAAQPKPSPGTYVMVPDEPRPSLRAWLTGHMPHFAFHRASPH